MSPLISVWVSMAAGSATMLGWWQLRAWRRARREAAAALNQSLVSGGRLQPDGMFTGLHATGTNALDIIARVEQTGEFPVTGRSR